MINIRPIPEPILSDPTVRARFVRRIMGQIDWPADAVGCWIWTGRKYHFGHGNTGYRDENGPSPYMVHRIMYAWWYGDTDMVLDHLCDTPSCVNPMHLNPCTPYENNARSETSITAVNARKTHCVHGHPFDDENTYWHTRPDGRRRRSCRECQRQRSAVGNARRKAKRHAAKRQAMYSGYDMMEEQT